LGAHFLRKGENQKKRRGVWKRREGDFSKRAHPLGPAIEKG